MRACVRVCIVCTLSLYLLALFRIFIISGIDFVTQKLNNAPAKGACFLIEFSSILGLLLVPKTQQNAPGVGPGVARKGSGMPLGEGF